MNKIKFMIAALLLVFASCEKELPVEVSFNSETYQLKVGETLDLSGEVMLKNTDAKPVFSVADAAVATVSETGTVTAVSKGETLLTVSVEGMSATCTVKVTEVVAEKITVTAPEAITADGAWVKISVAVEPQGYDSANLVWSFTPSVDGMGVESEKVNACEYNIKVVTYVEGGSITVKVEDSLSDLSQTAVIAVEEKVVPAEKISLTMPEEITEGEENWATVIATVTPEGYDPTHLFWEFEPSSTDLGFKYEKVSNTEYKVCFATYVPDGSVTVKVSDEISANFNQGKIKVLKKPAEGVNKLGISPETLALNVGDEPVTLTLTIDPQDYDMGLLEWTSSDEKVVTVADGTVTVVGEGEATVKVKDTVSGKEASCKVTVAVPVKEAVVKKIVLNKTSLTMRVGEAAAQLTASCYDELGNLIENYAGLVWSVDETSGNTVEVSQKGVVTAKNAGNALIYVRDSKNTFIYATCQVYVQAAEVKVKSVSLQPSSKLIEIGETFTLTALITPDNAENKTLTYASSDENVATVSATGVVTGVATGEAVITATAANGVKDECKVIVANDVWVYLSETEVTMMVGDEKTLTARITPEDAPEQTAKWASSDETVATVTDGVVKAIAEGTAIITATANGRTAECKITVESQAVEFDITLTPERTDVLAKGLMQDQSLKIFATYVRKKDGNDYVPMHTEWKSSDNNIATVDDEGNVTAVAEHIEKSGFENGKKVIITHVADGKENELELVVVKVLPEQVILTAIPEVNGEKYKMLHGETFTFKAKVLPEKASQEVWFAGGGFMYVNDDTYTATTIGNAYFTAYAKDNTDAKLDFTIEVLPVMATNMVLSKSALDMVTGSQAALGVTFTPATPSYTSLSWTSSDESVAAVDQNGIVKAVAAGNAVITVTQAENNLTCTCAVTVSDPVQEMLAVGDYYYSDGTTSKKLDASKKVIGVVFSVNNPEQMGDAKLVADHSGCVNGFVLSLVEYTSAFGDYSYMNMPAWCRENGYDMSNETAMNGYGNTLGGVAYRQINPTYVEIFDVENGPAAKQNAATASPEGASSWYIPSYKEMQCIYENINAVNASIEAVSGTKVTTENPYWSSTLRVMNDPDSFFSYGFNMNTGTWTDVQTLKSKKLPVRMILAF